MELGVWIIGAAAAGLAALTLPFAAVAIHQRKKRRLEKAAAYRKKERIQL